MQLQTLECPHCGAGINLPPGATSVKCEYCGSIFAINDGRPSVGSGPVAQPMLTPFQRTAAGCATGCGIWFVMAVLLTMCMSLLGLDTTSTDKQPSPVVGLATLLALLLALSGFFLVAFPQQRARLLVWWHSRRAPSRGR